MAKTFISKRKWLLLPIETKSREFLAKLLLSCFGAEKGWGCILGKGGIIKGKQNLLPKGTFIEKSISPGRMKNIKKAFENNNKVSAWCEEGLLYLNKEDYRQRRLELESFDAIDYFFTWGENQATDTAESLNRNYDKIIKSGNPRFDLLRPELREIYFDKSEQYQKDYGQIILINTKLGVVNNNLYKTKDGFIEHMRKIGKIRDLEQENLMAELYDFQTITFKHFVNLLPELSRRYHNYTIVLRPHPSETNETWIEIAKDFKNVKILYEGSSNDWIMASKLMIHNNCTTGIEAFLLDKPAISFRPYKKNHLECEFTDFISHKAGNLDELFTIIDKILKNEEFERSEEKQKKIAYAKKYIANTKDNPFACEVIIKALEKLDISLNCAVFPIKLSLKEKIKNIIKKLIGKKDNNKKFPSLSPKEMNEAINLLQKATGRFKNIKFCQVDVDTFCVYKE